MMRVIYTERKYKTNGHNFRVGEVMEISIVNVIPCCDEMKRAWADGYIGFGEKVHKSNKNPFVNIYVCHNHQEGSVYESMSIRHCPFCKTFIRVLPDVTQ
jgi:hypothetical protein